MRTIIFWGVIWIIISGSLQAQESIFSGGLHLGTIASQVDGDQMGGYNKIGLTAGGFVQVALPGNMALAAGLDYSGRGGRQDGDFVPIGAKPFITRLHYVDLPFLLYYRPIDEWQIGAGVGAGYLFFSTLKDNAGNVVDNDLYEYKNFDITSQVVVNYYIRSLLAVYGGFSYSLNKIRLSPPQKNRYISLGVKRFF